MWVAKNKSGEVTLFYKKPKYKDGYWLSQDGKYFNIDASEFPRLTVEEPIEYELVEFQKRICDYCGREYVYHDKDIVDESEPEKENFWMYTECPYCRCRNQV